MASRLRILAERAEGRHRLVLGPAVLGPDPAERAVGDPHHARAADGAGLAGPVPEEDRVLHGRAADPVGVLPGAGLPVAGRQDAGAGEVLDAARGPERAGAAGAVSQPRVLPDLGEVGEDDLPEPLRVGQRDPAGPADGDGLEVLRPHHRAQPGAPRRPVGVVHDAGVAHPLLPGEADADDPGLAIAQLPLDRLLGFERPPPRQMGGRPDVDAVVDDGEVDQLRGLALHDDAVVAGVLELVRHEAAGVGLTEAVGRGGFRDDREASRAGRECARQRAHREHQPVLRPQGVAPPGDLVEQDPRPHPPAAQVPARPGPVERLDPALSAAEIHSEQSSCVSVHRIRLSRCVWANVWTPFYGGPVHLQPGTGGCAQSQSIARATRRRVIAQARIVRRASAAAVMTIPKSFWMQTNRKPCARRALAAAALGV